MHVLMLIYKQLERLAGEDDRILDLGTKNGKYLEDIPGEKVGIDLKFDFPVKTEALSFMYADGRQLPFRSNSFDLVVMNQVLEHVCNQEAIVSEVARVLEPNGIALFSFPNRFALNRPHGLPRFLSFFPKSLGKRIAPLILNQEEYEYYLEELFPLSSFAARRMLNDYFKEIEYVTIDESINSPEIYGDSLAPRVFVFFLPLIQLLTSFKPFAWFFEAFWSYVGYKCTTPRTLISQ